MTKKINKFLIKSQQKELDAVLMYNALAKRYKNQMIKDTFIMLASEEGKHARIFKEITNKVLAPKKIKSKLLLLLSYICPKRILFRLISKGEYSAYKKYECISNDYPTTIEVRDDEKRHGDIVYGLLMKLVNA